MMQTYLFDDKGELWDGKSRKLAEILHASLSSADLLKYVVRNLGFIAVTDNNGSLRLQLRPAIVSQMALGGLLYWMHDRPIERVLISSLGEEWSHELVRTRKEVVRWLLTKVRRDGEDRRGDFLNQPRPLHDLPDTSPLRAVLNAWAECDGVYDQNRLLPVLQNATNGRFFLVEAAASSPSIMIRDIGNGFTRDAGYWLGRTIGHRVEDQPDYAYGKWLAEVYGKVVTSRAPSLDDVDAVITWPQQPRISYRYRRLVVPFETGKDSTLLLSATLIDPAIDLRVKSS
jgi:hypothetical protein